MKIKGGRQTRKIDGLTVAEYYRRYVELDETVKDLAKQRDTMAANLKEYAAENGVEDGKGHRWVETPEGTFKRERRAATFLQEDEAREWLRSIGKEKEVLKRVTTTEFDVEKFNGIVFEAKLTPADTERFYVVDEKFYLIKQKGPRPPEDTEE